MSDTARQTGSFLWRLAHGRSLELGPAAVIMGVLNVTPDSFSDGGRFLAPDAAVEQALRMVEEGAAIVDIGGESTRPRFAPVEAAEEQQRIMPVIEAIAARSDVLISVDTWRAETARLAVAAGAHIVNDIWALQKDPEIASVVAETGAGAVLMHNSRDRETEPDLIADQFLFLSRSLKIAREAGIGAEHIVLDPGFGFGKETAEINLELVARFEELHALGAPLLAGTSRKRFIGTVTGRDPDHRAVGTAATSVALRLAGAVLFRVHDVAINADALRMADAILAQRSRR
ncbi:dihydropteroate synthase [Nitratireductor mangrovi]|uniref:Dihydropteroate synthase n=1 Tax=Nitratireductor mangrovi TaxID=2599600 RepID=A0A5B8L2A5_9HYPH|nr:dihydropteroate synthase [Nitratireductor mangrovi]QDZ01919.1 dihydropteroate synthase [Nitratireductor mangrovi]